MQRINNRDKNEYVNTVYEEESNDPEAYLRLDVFGVIVLSSKLSRVYVRYLNMIKNSSGWPSGQRRQTQVLVFVRGLGFKSHF